MKKLISVNSLIMLLALFSFGISNASERIGTLMVHLTFDSGNFAIAESWIVDEIYPIRKGEFSGKSALQFQLTDSNGQQISRIRINDPTIIRGPLIAPERAGRLQMSQPHRIVKKQQGSVVLRLPYHADARFINLLDSGAGPVNGSGIRTAAKPGIKQQMDLLNY